MGGGDTLMFIFSRRSKVILDCYTYADYALLHNPIQPAAKFVPEWFAKMPSNFIDGNNFFSSSTIKKCPAIVSMLTKGFIIPLWCDLAISVQHNQDGTPFYEYQFADKRTVATDHAPEQWGDLWDDKVSHMKINSVWRFKTKEKLDWMWLQPKYHAKDLPLQIVEAIDEFKYQNSTNINAFIDNTEPVIYQLEAGTPLVHIIPLTDKEVVVKNHLISREEWDKLHNVKFFKFQNNYKEAKKCPFHKNTY